MSDVSHTVSADSRINSYLKPFADFLAELDRESERGAVLSAAAYVDDLLGKTIAAFLVQDARVSELVEDYPGPLSSFSARILTAHALGLISEAERAECTNIRKVRNEFAHAVKMSFGDDRVRSLCANLKFIVAGTSPRGQFTSSAVANRKSIQQAVLRGTSAA